MANLQVSSDYREDATVDTDPGVPGFFTKVVKPRLKGGNLDDTRIFFSKRGTGIMTVSLQFKCPGDSAWSTYLEVSSLVDRLKLETGERGVQWRAGVLSVGYSSGSSTFGFGW